MWQAVFCDLASASSWTTRGKGLVVVVGPQMCLLHELLLIVSRVRHLYIDLI